ncbi:MAG: cytochrome c biogenesis protein ResB [Calditrichaeota bacterium]|nr:cytochrome c biogenesis protein ResB [Calditrichota bacterium]
MKFAVWILVITAGLALFSLLLGEFLPPDASDNVLVQGFGLSDPFRSWWFRLSLGLLALSLMVCVIERTPVQFRLAFRRSLRTDPAQFLGAPNRYLGNVGKGFDPAALFRQMNLSIAAGDGKGYRAWVGSAGGLSRLGPLLSHIGMLLLILGGLAGSMTGYSTRVMGRAGDVVAMPEWGFAVRVDTFFIDYYPVGLNLWVEAADRRRGKVTALKSDSAYVEFSVMPGRQSALWLDRGSLRTDFAIFDGGRQMPYQGNIRSYVSDVTVLDGERELARRRVEVNSPLRHRSYRFYQSSFDVGAPRTTVDSVMVICRDAEIGEVVVPLKIGGGRVNLPGSSYQVEAERFLSDFRLDDKMQPFSASTELRNPAVRVRLYRGDADLGAGWAFRGMIGSMGGAALPVEFGLKKVVGLRSIPGGYTTIFDVHRDGGRPLVWAGFFIVTIGLILTYSMHHRQVWILEWTKPDGGLELHIAGQGHREEAHFERWIGGMIEPIGLKRQQF